MHDSKPNPQDVQYLEISLTKGYVTLISIEDRDLVDLKWHAHVGVTNVYASGYQRGSGKKNPVYVMLHRLILSRILDRPLLKTEFVDHINGNSLDNRRENLRLATKQQNGANAKLRRDNKAGLKGIYRHQNRWTAMIGLNGKTIYLGCYDTAEEAHQAYCKKAEELFGEYARPK